MKKAYVTPTVEKVEFQYDKVVVASGLLGYRNDGQGGCFANNGENKPCWVQIG